MSQYCDEDGLTASEYEDMVNNPPHYQTDSGLEAIEVIRAFFRDNYNLGTVFKYIARTGKKWDTLEDLKKARWYLDREIEWRENDAHESPHWWVEGGDD